MREREGMKGRERERERKSREFKFTYCALCVYILNKFLLAIKTCDIWHDSS